LQETSHKYVRNHDQCKTHIRRGEKNDKLGDKYGNCFYSPKHDYFVQNIPHNIHSDLLLYGRQVKSDTMYVHTMLQMTMLLRIMTTVSCSSHLIINGSRTSETVLNSCTYIYCTKMTDGSPRRRLAARKYIQRPP